MKSTYKGIRIVKYSNYGRKCYFKFEEKVFDCSSNKEAKAQIDIKLAK